MKNLLISMLMFTVVLLNNSCKDNFDQTDLDRKMENLIVSSTFDWETAHDVEFSITADVSTMIRIRSENGEYLYHQGFYSSLPAPYVINLNLPKNVTRLMINNQLVVVSGNSLNVKLEAPLKVPYMWQVPTIPTPIVYWKFDENQGDAVNEENGLLNGIATGHSRVSGINGNALELDGVAGQIGRAHV